MCIAEAALTETGYFHYESMSLPLLSRFSPPSYLKRSKQQMRGFERSGLSELKAEVENLAIAAKQTRDRVDSVQAAVREDRRTVLNLRKQLEQLTDRVTSMEDRSRRNNVRLVGLPDGAEGSDAAGFLTANLSKWIPALKGCDIEIEWAHRVYDGRKSNSKRPRTLIFRVLRWQDRSAILKGARQAYPVKYTQDNVTLLFFPDFSSATSARRRNLNQVLRRMTPLGLQPFLIYPAIIKLRHNGEQMMFDSSQKAEDFISSLPQKKSMYNNSLQNIQNETTTKLQLLFL
uniref:L1 transposable element RRM domain-containing protein n=1 Tax=Sinocyclocheilus grahami TaxID=75366 RepID=A0A672K4J5_SINGR